MGKMTSLLEKYKLIEKEESSSPSSNEASMPASETTSQVISDPVHDDSLEQAIPAESTPKEAAQDKMPSYNKAPDMVQNTTVSIPETDNSTFHVKDHSSAYDNLLNIEEVYEFLNLDRMAATDTVFLLENLIKALPDELPEFVKKTTVHNIITASAMDLPKLLDDGHVRSESLHQFAADYSKINSDEITALKSEIARLSAIIAEYHQQIKYKETLIAEETTLIQTEQNRIQSILEFFTN